MALQRPIDVAPAEDSASPLAGRLCWAGFLFVVVLGTFWHFVYAWSGRSAWVGFVAPVSESVWEHTKLLVAPLLIWSAIEATVIPQRARLPWAAVAACLVGSITIVVGFYAYTAVLGSHRLWADIGLFVLAAALALGVHGRVLRGDPRLPWWVGTAVALVIVLAYAGLTVAPPDWGPFLGPGG